MMPKMSSFLWVISSSQKITISFQMQPNRQKITQFWSPWSQQHVTDSTVLLAQAILGNGIQIGSFLFVMNLLMWPMHAQFCQSSVTVAASFAPKNFVNELRVQGFESSVNDDFQKENDILNKIQKLKIIHFSNYNYECTTKLISTWQAFFYIILCLWSPINVWCDASLRGTKVTAQRSSKKWNLPKYLYLLLIDILFALLIKYLGVFSNSHYSQTTPFLII